jgi:hypothetical protein
MTGNTNLQEVLNSMQVSCDEIEYGFATTDKNANISVADVLGTFQESEGLTILATKQYLEESGLNYEGPFAKLTVEVHTSLELVGLTAVLASKLAEKAISANVFAAYYHDHIFVQYEAREEAIATLSSIKA